MNFLVTGGAGFIGSHVCERLLRDGHRVWAFDDLNDFYDPQFKRRNLREIQSLAKPFEFVHGDITDAAALDEFFSSRQVRPGHPSRRARGRAAQPRRAGALPARERRGHGQRARSRAEIGVKKITIASSSSVYGVNSKVPFSESDPIFSAISPYAASKLACEALGHVWHHIYKMDVAMLRFFTVYGPRQRPDLAIHKFAKLIDAGQTDSGFRRRQHGARLHATSRTSLDGVIACTQKEFGFEIFNLGESQTVKLSRLIELLEAALGKKAVIDRQPLQPGDVPITFADISKARARLGYNPQVKIEEGIKLFADWFRKNTG